MCMSASDQPVVHIGAFSAEQAQRLSGVSLGQLRLWHRNGFLPASFASEASRSPFARLYSFKDVVTLRVLNQLRNVHRVSMQELRKVADALADMGPDKWTSLRFWVHNRKVVFREPDTRRRREITTRQYVAELGVEIDVAGTQQALANLNERDVEHAGKIARKKFVAGMVPLIAGTRIPVAAVQQFANAGYSIAQISLEYPTLAQQDIEAALSFKGDLAA